MFPFEFAIDGIPISANVKYRTGKAKAVYRNWVEYVRRSAALRWLPDTPPATEAISVELRYFYSQHHARDADNIAKPIRLVKLVYVDDSQITDLIIRKCNLATRLRFPQISPLLAEKIEAGKDFVYVKIELSTVEDFG
jgi:Holliday junction resolvase RusA-like endonuclease